MEPGGAVHTLVVSCAELSVGIPVAAWRHLMSVWLGLGLIVVVLVAASVLAASIPGH
jgi:hypothetical protein